MTRSFNREVASGDRRRGLEALRSVLTAAIGAGPADRDLAALSARLMSVMEELDGLPSAREGTPLDELAKRRAARSPVADVPPRTNGGEASR